MNKYKRKSKTKTLALGIGILSSAAVVSTGFAAWIIAGGDSVTGTGNISADEVVRKEHNIVGLKDDLGSIFFGAPENSTTTYKFLNSSGEKKENLILAASFGVQNVETTLTDTKDSLITIFDDATETGTRFTEETTGDTSYKAAADKNYVAALPTIIWGESGDKTAPGVYINYNSMDTSETTKALFDLKIVFGWGSAFENQNPFDYYNGLDNTEANRDAAATALGALHNVNATFKLTIVTK